MKNQEQNCTVYLIRMQIRLHFQRCTPPSLTIPVVDWNDRVSYRNGSNSVKNSQWHNLQWTLEGSIFHRIRHGNPRNFNYEVIMTDQERIVSKEFK
jgi:hypothetical protein